MALADIAQKILAEIDEQIKGLEADFIAQKKVLEGKCLEQEKSALAQLGEKTDKALADVEHKIAAMARQENKKTLLGARRAILDKAMATFLEALCAADASVKELIYKKLLSAVDAKTGDIRVAAGDESILKALAKDFTITADKNLKGGFVLQSGGAEVDNSFENLVYSVYRDDLEMYFASQLKLVA